MATTSTRIRGPRPLTIAECQALVTGIPKNCTNATFTIAGQTMSATQAVAFVQSVLTAVSTTAAAKTGWKDAQMAEQKVLAQDGATVRALRGVIETMFSNQTTVLAEFLITPRKTPKPLSAAARAAANAKAKATREARGTLGKVQKAAISGDVTGVTITPITSGSSNSSGSTTAPVAAPAQPAPAASAVVAPVASPSASPAPATPASSPVAVPVGTAAVAPGTSPAASAAPVAPVVAK